MISSAIRCVLLGSMVCSCGSPSDLGTAMRPPASVEPLLTLGTPADLVLGQMSERATQAARTDSGGFGQPLEVATYQGEGGLIHLFVSDTLNRRILGYRNAGVLSQGGNADLVINQDDMFTTDGRNVPATQWSLGPPVGLAADPDRRLYVYGGLGASSRVLVFDDPFATDTVFDYELMGVPANVQAVRMGPENRIAVVGLNGLVFYDRGNTAPYANETVSVPCPNALRDVAWTTDRFYAACGSGLNCIDLVRDCGTCFEPDCYCGNLDCAGIAVFSVDPSSLFPVGDTRPHNLVRLRPSGSPIANNEPLRMIENQGALFVLDGLSSRIAKFNDVRAAASAKLLDEWALPLLIPDNVNLTFGQVDRTCHAADDATVVSPVTQRLCNALGMALDRDGTLWAADTGNQRVLAFKAAMAVGADNLAEVVVGQPDYAHRIANRLESNSFQIPAGVALGRASGGLPRVAVADPPSNRVLVFNNALTMQPDAEPVAVLGQPTALGYLAPTVLTMTQKSLGAPAHVAMGQEGQLLVADSIGRRVLRFDNLTVTYPDASACFGCQPGPNYAVPGQFPVGAVAMSSTHVFVASRHSILAYPTTGGPTPQRVFGQDPVDTDAAIDTCVAAAPDSMCAFRGTLPADTTGVLGLAVDNSGTLWVADTGNNRVLWFDDPMSGSSPAAGRIADGVVGQPNLASSQPNSGSHPTPNALGLFRPTGVAVSSDGVLWVMDAGNNRVLAFPSPKIPSPGDWAAGASVVLGQRRFNTGAANNSLNGVSAATLDLDDQSHMPGLALSPDGRALFLSDSGNARVLRMVDNRPPALAGMGEYEVAPGSSVTVPLEIVDPEGDSWTVQLVTPVPAGVELSTAPPMVSFTAPADMPLGASVRVTVAVTDQGPRPQVVSGSIVFRAALRRAPAEVADPPRPLPAAVDDSCECRSVSGPMWLLLALPLGRWVRARRRAQAAASRLF